MTGGEKIAISTGIKTADGVVKLFFAPQLDKLKNNLREKFVEKQISDKNIEQIFTSYLESLYNKCHTVNTIMFSQEVLLSSIYEPLILIANNNLFYQETNSIDNSQYIDMVINDYLENNILLVDTAGMGKSTFSKYLIIEIMKNTKHTKIPIFIELRKINEDETLSEYIVKDINLEYKNIITENMFFKLMEKGTFIFIFDGFDEIDEDNENRIGEQISQLSTDFTKNIIILTSRNQSYIPSIHNNVTCNFKPLDLEQIKSLVLRYDKCASITVGKDLLAHENFKTLNYNLFNTPLMVNLLYKSFGYNNTIDSNVVTFYDEMFNALYKGHDLTKAGFSRKKYSNLNFEDFKVLFNAFCFVTLYEKKVSFKTKMEVLSTINKASILASIELKDMESFFGDLLNNVPFLMKDGLEFKFLHKTIIEFFAAEFLCYSERKIELIQKIKDNNLFSTFTKSFEFLYKINKSLYINEIGNLLINEYLNFYDTQYREYNDYFKTILFFNNDISLKIDSEDNHRINDIGIDGGYNSQSSYPLYNDNKSYFISILQNQTDRFNYTPSIFFNSILKITNKKPFVHYMSKQDKDIEKILEILELGKLYSITSVELNRLQNINLINIFILHTIFSNNGSFVDENHSLFYIDHEKCKDLISQNKEKLNVLD